MADAEVWLVMSTFPDRERAVAAGRILVEEGLAACVSVTTEVRSIYRFEGQIHDEPEVLCLVKTTQAVEPELRARLLTLHPYSLPEIVAVPVVAGHPAYLEWVASSVHRR